VRDNAGPAEDSQGFLLALLGEASEELRQVLSILARAGRSAQHPVLLDRQHGAQSV